MLILQGTLDLHGDGDGSVHAVVDFDTGRIGFVQVKDDVHREYDYASAPKEWKGALVSKIEPLLSKQPRTNFRITRNAQP